jgi:hypothetical protein
VTATRPRKKIRMNALMVNPVFNVFIEEAPLV